MLFNSLSFLIFLPIVVVLYYLLAAKFRWLLIFVASCYFYMAFVPEYILILFFLILVDYFAAILIERNQGHKRKLFLIASLTCNILLLFFFKYFNFANHNLESLGSLFGWHIKPFHLNIILPIGLSFHTFQSMGYTVEVYRGNQKAEKHLGYFANYVLFFPQMVAGPIERFQTLGNALKAEHQPVFENFKSGFRLILFGLFIKMVVADNLAPHVNLIYEAPLQHTGAEVLLAILFFSFQIYADFFGYSTIALGSAKLLGIDIMDNFKTPYLSKSITEFWSRWHISLSTWFRDYVYITLGGNKVSIPRWTFNILIVFAVSGLWHGASWTFVIWGLLHGCLRVLENYFSKVFHFKLYDKWNLLSVALSIKTFILCAFIWVFFRAETFAKAMDIFSALKHNVFFGLKWHEVSFPIFLVCLMLLIDVTLYGKRFDYFMDKLSLPSRWAIYSVLLFLLLALSGTQKFNFIYFQF